MIAYKNAMNEMYHLKDPKPILIKEHNIIKYPKHKIINCDNSIIPFPKHKMNYIIENPKSYIKKYNENKDVTNYTNEIKKIHSLDIKLKHDNDKPPDYYQYNMKNKTIEDFRLDAYQTENNIKSNMSILKEENNSNKTIDEIKTNEDDFQSNLNLILNEYKNKQNYYNTTKKEISDNELHLETDDTNKKLNELTTENKKLPIIYKTLSKPIILPIPVVITEDEKNNKLIDSIFSNDKILKTKRENYYSKRNKMTENELIELDNFVEESNKDEILNEELLKNGITQKAYLTKLFTRFFRKTNKFINKKILLNRDENLTKVNNENLTKVNNENLTKVNNENLTKVNNEEKNDEENLLNFDEIYQKINDICSYTNNAKITKQERDIINQIKSSNNLTVLSALTSKKSTIIKQLNKEISEKNMEEIE